ncbi:MAG TPA: HAD family hydrolase [Anaerohalosphaeraceae bacterium]|nr:HAD family hydrolase [Anaerohalosphaeraceae bacterium]HOL87902.1 HAD family hydrolase [Anaerohalosphaeraceae bacterium]HPP55400.1 HAD family hydrolase [Anaerohalosphaeraceae bacterium]
MSVQSVLFDLDGTLTVPLLDFDLIRRQIGLPPDCPSILAAIENLPETQRRQAWEILCRHEEVAALHSTLQPSAKSLLDYLRQKNIKTGILTRNSRASAQTVLTKHRITVDGMITREDGPPKPDPFGVLALCRLFQTIPSRTLVVGDFLHDLQSAKNAGAVAVLFKSHHRADEFVPWADFVIHSLDEIRLIIDNLSG